MIKGLYILLGTLFLGIGILGVVLPVLPTTPFLLVTLYFYSKGSNRFHTLFVSSWIYKKYLLTFYEERAMKRTHKWRLMLFTDGIILISVVIAPLLWVKVLLIVLNIMKYVYFFTQVKTLE